jgi:hypothetical protein
MLIVYITHSLQESRRISRARENFFIIAFLLMSLHSRLFFSCQALASAGVTEAWDSTSWSHPLTSFSGMACLAML